MRFGRERPADALWLCGQTRERACAVRDSNARKTAWVKILCQSSGRYWRAGFIGVLLEMHAIGLQDDFLRVAIDGRLRVLRNGRRTDGAGGNAGKAGKC